MPHFPIAKSWDDVIQAIGALYSEDHAFKTLVFDSVDHFEPMVWAETCRRNGWASIEAARYGKGYVAASDVWREFLDVLNALSVEKNMRVPARSGAVSACSTPRSGPPSWRRTATVYRPRCPSAGLHWPKPLAASSSRPKPLTSHGNEPEAGG